MYEKSMKWLEEQCSKLEQWPDLQKLFKNCFLSTINTTTEVLEDGTSFVFTGDIHAMWLRDSSAQVSHYVHLCEVDEDMKSVVKGLIKRQFKYILLDPYANAFNKEENGRGHQDDITEMSDWLWERKYEIDSLCYPIWLSYKYWQVTKDESIFDETFRDGLKKIMEVWEIEQHHAEKSSYSFDRNAKKAIDTLSNGGKGSPVKYTGMTWSGFRPSDDSCTYHYLVPSNQFAVVTLEYAMDILNTVYQDGESCERAEKLKDEIQSGIEKYGIIKHEKYGEMFAYETDGENHHLMDDANVPSLLSLPYLGYCSKDDEIYQNTRNFILSKDNPFFFEGKELRGVGSPHTPEDYVWHISVIMQALTSSKEEEIADILGRLLNSHADTFFMHEGVNANNSKEFTRPWFAWANSLFAMLVIELLPRIEEVMKQVEKK